MRRVFGGLLACVAVLGCSANDANPTGPADPATGKADVHGEDDRQETYAFPEGSFERRMAHSSAALVKFKKVRDRGQGVSDLTGTENLQHLMDLCPQERFAGQPATGFCSATLVAPDLVLTNAHCLFSKAFEFDEFFRDEVDEACEDMRIVFGFGYDEPAEDLYLPFERVPQEQIFECSAVEAIRLEGDTSFIERHDVALLRLDRPVQDRQPVTLLDEDPAFGTPIVQIGHPSGIPQKLSMSEVVDRSEYDPPVVDDTSASTDGFFETTGDFFETTGDFFETTGEFSGSTGGFFDTTGGFGSTGGFFEPVDPKDQFTTGFTMMTDAFPGNSGGGVFDLKAEALVGLMTWGNTAASFVEDTEAGCNRIAVCGETATCPYLPIAYAIPHVLRWLEAEHPELLKELHVVRR